MKTAYSAGDKVAPRAGAWIEAASVATVFVAGLSLPVRERGLKRLVRV